MTISKSLLLAVLLFAFPAFAQQAPILQQLQDNIAREEAKRKAEDQRRQQEWDAGIKKMQSDWDAQQKKNEAQWKAQQEEWNRNAKTVQQEWEANGRKADQQLKMRANEHLHDVNRDKHKRLYWEKQEKVWQEDVAHFQKRWGFWQGAMAERQQKPGLVNDSNYMHDQQRIWDEDMAWLQERVAYWQEQGEQWKEDAEFYKALQTRHRYMNDMATEWSKHILLK